MMGDILLLLHELLCLVLFGTVFCRAVRMTASVRTDVRLAFFLLSLVACAGIPAPLAWGFRPTPFSVLLLAGIVIVQMVTARYWRHGVPYSFYRPECAPRRRDCDLKGGCRGKP